MKHLKGWGFRDLERSSQVLVYGGSPLRRPKPHRDFTTFSPNLRIVEPQVTEEIHQRVVGLAR